MDRNGINPNVPSRIPRVAGSNKSFAGSGDIHQEPLPNIISSMKPSRLEQLQMEYQKNILKQKEEKLITMFESNQQRALQKVNQTRGLVKEFSNERRVANGGHNSQNTPSIEQLYLQQKIQYQAPQSNTYMSNSGPLNLINKPFQKYSLINGKINTGMERTAGRDRSKLLLPINRTVDERNNPFAQRKAQMVRPRTYKGASQQKEYTDEEQVPKSAPPGDDFNNNKYSYEEEDSDDNSVPNAKQLQYLQEKRKRLQMQKSNNKISDAALSADQSKQGQQYNNKQSARSNKQKRYNETDRISSSDEGYDEVNDSKNNTAESELKLKQQELLRQIESQQKELDRLRQKRKLAEAEELRELEHRKKNEDERKRKIAEEETVRQKEKEEERIKKQLAEEKKHQTEEEDNRLRPQSKNSESSDTTISSNVDLKVHMPTPQYYNKKPTPPSQPKPQNTRKPPQAALRQDTRSVTPKGDHTALYAQADQIEGAFEDTGTLLPCFNCGRKFAEDRLSKHEKSCKNLTKKRKILDPAKLRTRGTEMEKYQNHRQPSPTKIKKKNWRTQHQNFIDTIRYAKKVSQVEKDGGNVADLPPPPTTENPDYVQCPHCSRKFNETAAERHIQHCANTHTRPAPPKRK